MAPFSLLKRYPLKTHEVYALLTLTMAFDHVTQYLMSDALWLRAIAHIFTASLFIFVGYNIGSRISKRLFIWALLLIGADYAFAGFMGIFPMTALVTIILSRWAVEPMTDFALRSRLHFWAVVVILLLLVEPSAYIMEYGTLALLLIFTGRLIRGGAEIPRSIVSVGWFYIFSYSVLLGWLINNFGFSWRESLLMVIPAALYGYMTYDIKSIVRNTLQDKRKDIVRSLCIFFARNTLEIYGAILMALKITVILALRSDRFFS